jgi:hypothetical protein
VIEGFQDALVASKNVNVYGTDGQLMERARDTIWRPQQYISVGQDRIVGSAVSAKGKEQLSVPATLGFQPNDTFELDALELRDQLRDGQLGKASTNYLASRINGDVLSVATLQGTLVVKVTAAAGKYDHVALCDSLCNEQGIAADDRFLMLNSRDYNGMAADLANRTSMVGKPSNAYERSMVGEVAGFSTFKLDSGKRIAAAAWWRFGHHDGHPRDGSELLRSGRRALPRLAKSRTSTTATRRSRCPRPPALLRATAFTIAAVNAVHHINKGDTGQLKTFRVIAVPSSTTLVISPPIISNQGASDVEANYQNCVVNTRLPTRRSRS